METYLFKYGIWIALFWSVYRFFFHKETFFGFNRVFLLSGLVLSFVLASCQYRYSVMLSLPLAAFSGNSPVQEVQSGFAANRIPVVIGIYLAGVLVVLLHHLRGLNKIRNMIRKQGTSLSVIETAGIRSSFSFFGYIFMDKSARLSDVERRLILEHETAHVEQRHWIDLLLAQTVCILQWFNPFAWLYLQAVKENHEFLADRAVLRRGNSPAVYHATLINCALKTPVFAFTSSFTNYNNKFKRIVMMKKNVSKSTRKFAVLLLVPAFAAFLSAFAKPEYRYSTSVPTNDTVVVIPNESHFLFEKVAPKKASSDVAFYVDGKETSSVKDLNPDDIQSITVMKDKTAMELYGKENVVSIITKKHAQDTAGKTDSAGSKIKHVRIDGNKLLMNVDDADGREMQIIIDGKGNSGTFKYADGKEGLYFKADEFTIGGRIVIDEKENSGTLKYADRKEELSLKADEFTIGGREPLIIVDGEEYSGNLKSIDKNDIASISIMKETSSVNLYGEKGKNGVVIITTKPAHEAKKRNGDKRIYRSCDEEGKIKFRYNVKEEPLIIVDGKEYSGTIKDINENDIKSFSIIKDSSSTDRYGEKGKNGVIIITTKPERKNAVPDGGM
jgi:TonB-dependent SusC/RagA subfamily outer membrane receptor